MKLALFLAAAGYLVAAESTDPGEFFELRVRPVLAKNCYGCHSGNGQAGLRVDSRDALLQGGVSGPAIVTGDPDHSLLIQAVSHTHARLKMPPGGKLTAEEISHLATWIRAGAIWPQRAPAAPATVPAYRITAGQRAFWSFQPAGKPELPPVKDTAWAKTAVDRFIMAALEKRGMRPAPPASRAALIRRSTFDLTGLPPTPEEVDAFVQDRSPAAFSRVIDRLLASPRYGERWGRHWLDVARYSDDKLNSTMEEPYANAFRYRDWVVAAFNANMPYDVFVKAQLAGDALGEEHMPGLGFFGLSPEFQDDRVDAATRGFLGLTVACAQCHDHKYDPIPAADYYSLLAVFNNTSLHEYPLAEKEVVDAYRKQKAKVEKQDAALRKFLEAQANQLADILAARTADFMLAARHLAPSEGLDKVTLERWCSYLSKREHEHPFLKRWLELEKGGAPPAAFREAAAEFERLVLAVREEKKEVDDKNHIRLGLNPSRGDLSSASLLSLERNKYVLFRDLFENKGVLWRDGDQIGPYLQGEWTQHVSKLRADLEAFRKAMPPQYPFVHGITDLKERKKQHIYLRGDRQNPGAEVPARFLAILSKGEAKPFTRGSGRLDLAEAIADPANPLTARVMANRIWQHHFGQGIVRTPSNFGELGDRPSHPELLDYLAARFVESRWSIKAMHREIMLSAAYRMSSDYSASNYQQDPENRLLWRANRTRLDAESLRDALLYVSGSLDLTMGGKAERLTDDNRRRTVYGYVSRKKLDVLLALFDFPNPNNTSEQRLATNVPLQRLFFMNSGLVAKQAGALAERLSGADRDRIAQAYRLLYGRAPEPAEVRLGLEYVKQAGWPQYAQVLLSASEFSFID